MVGAFCFTGKKVKAQMLKTSLQKCLLYQQRVMFYLLNEVCHLGYSYTSDHLTQSISRAVLYGREKRVSKNSLDFWWQASHKKEYGCTNTPSNREREVRVFSGGHHKSSTYCNLCDRFTCRSSPNEQHEKQGTPIFFNRCLIFSFIIGIVRWLLLRKWM